MTTEEHVRIITPRPGRLEDTVPLVREKPAKYLYHATLDENLASIQWQGLKPVEDAKQCHWGGDLATKCLGRAYLTKDYGFALYYLGIIQKEKASNCLQIHPDSPHCIPDIVLLRVPANKIEDAQRDEHTEADYFVERVIPAKDIEYLHGEHCWKKLALQDPDIVEGISAGEWREPPSVEVSLWRDVDKELDQRSAALKNLAKMCSRKRR
jgi:hypothetical protein